MALSKRETKIVYVTLAVVLAAVLWTLGIGPLYDRYAEQQTLLDSEKQTYDKNKKLLSDGPRIQQEYKRVEAQFPKDNPEKRPDDSFPEEVMAAAQAILPGRQPAPGSAEREEIKGVPNYEFLTFPIKTSGELQNIATLLKGFDQKGFLVKSLVVQHSKGIDNPELNLDLTLARLVKVQTEDEGGRFNTPRKRTGGRR